MLKDLSQVLRYPNRYPWAKHYRSDQASGSVAEVDRVCIASIVHLEGSGGIWCGR